MTKKILLSLMISQFAFADSICQNYFQINYNRKNLESLSHINHYKIKRYNENIKNSQDVALQMRLINEQFHAELVLFRRSLNQIKSSKKALRIKNADPKAYLKYVDQRQEKLISRHIAQVDIITETLSQVLKQHNIPHTLKNGEMTSQKLSYKYISLILDPQSNLSSIRVLRKYQDMFDIPEITIDLMANIKLGSLGFRGESQIDMGVDGIENILTENLLLLVTKHESKHASFAKKRSLQIASPFHTKFIAQGTEPLSKVQTGYESYMSSEELYNFVNNAFWASARLRKVNEFTLKSKLADFKKMNEQIASSRAIAKQTKVLTKRFRTRINSFNKKNSPNDSLDIEYATKNLTPAQNAQEAMFYIISDPESKQFMMMFIEKELVSSVEEALQIRKSLMADFNKEIGKNGSPKTDSGREEFMNRFMTEEVEQTSHLRALFVNNANKQLDELELMAENVMEAAPLVLQKQNAFYEKIKSQTIKDETKLREAFLEQAQIVREFANLVKK